MAKSNKTTDLTVTSDVPEVIQVLRKKMEEFQTIETSVWVTPGKVNIAGTTVDIKEEKNIETLVKCLASVMQRAEVMQKAYEALDINKYPVIKIDGGTLEEWKKDIKLRIQIIDQKETVEKYKELVKDFESILDKEDKKKLLLKKAEALLG